jgi:K(+)-stimulated pyrophosphate-energized sodium pump
MGSAAEIFTQFGPLIGVVGLLYGLMVHQSISEIKVSNARLLDLGESASEATDWSLGRRRNGAIGLAAAAGLLAFLLFDWQAAAATLAGACASVAVAAIATRSSVRARLRASPSDEEPRGAGALQIAFAAGTVAGLAVLGIALLCFSVPFTVLVGLADNRTLESLGGLGAFAKVSAGLALGAACAAAGLRGGLDEDSLSSGLATGVPGAGRIPPEESARRVVAGCVGQSVAEISGGAADLFETISVTILAACVLSQVHSLGTDPLNGVQARIDRLALPLALAMVLVGTTLLANRNARNLPWSVPARALRRIAMRGVGLNLVASILVLLLLTGLRWTVALAFGIGVFGCVGLVIGADRFSSSAYDAAGRLAAAARDGAAPLLVEGSRLALKGAALALALLSFVVLAAHAAAGPFGVGMASVGMASVLPFASSFLVTSTVIGQAYNLSGLAGVGSGALEQLVRLRPAARELAFAAASAGLGAAVLSTIALAMAVAQLSGVDREWMSWPLSGVRILLGGAVSLAGGSLALRASAPSPRAAFPNGRATLLTFAVVLGVGTLELRWLGDLLIGSILGGGALGFVLLLSRAGWQAGRDLQESRPGGASESEALIAFRVAASLGVRFHEGPWPAVQGLMKLMSVTGLFLALAFGD